MTAALPSPALSRFVPKRKRPSVWVVLPVLFLVTMSLLPLLYVGLKAWEAGWHEALRLLWRPFVWGLLRNTLMLMVGVTVLCLLVGVALAWLLERSDLPGGACGAWCCACRSPCRRLSAASPGCR